MENNYQSPKNSFLKMFKRRLLKAGFSEKEVDETYSELPSNFINYPFYENVQLKPDSFLMNLNNKEILKIKKFFKHFGKYFSREEYADVLLFADFPDKSVEFFVSENTIKV